MVGFQPSKLKTRVRSDRAFGPSRNSRHLHASGDLPAGPGGGAGGQPDARAPLSGKSAVTENLR